MIYNQLENSKTPEEKVQILKKEFTKLYKKYEEDKNDKQNLRNLGIIKTKLDSIKAKIKKKQPQDTNFDTLSSASIRTNKKTYVPGYQQNKFLKKTKPNTFSKQDNFILKDLYKEKIDSNFNNTSLKDMNTIINGKDLKNNFKYETFLSSSDEN